MIPSFRLATIILAAGQSKRMGSINKLLMPIDGLPMIQRVADVAIESGSSGIYIVTGFECERVRSCLSGYDIDFVHNDSFREGMGTSVAEGVRAIANQRYDGVMILLGDLPYMKADTLKSAAENFAEREGRKIIIPTFNGEPGHPVVFPKKFFKELALLSGDRGAKALLARHQSSVVRIEVDDSGTTRDLDTPPFESSQ